MTNRKYKPISEHQTLNGILEVDWNQEYKGEYSCHHCEQGKLIEYYYCSNLASNLYLRCSYCKRSTNLSCHVPTHISNYRSDVECPNPLCDGIGPDGQKGWVYKLHQKTVDSKCYFCGVRFNSISSKHWSWVGSQSQNEILPFNFDEHTWDLKNFFDNPCQRLLSFQNIYPQWYRLEVKKYIHFLLLSNRFASVGKIIAKMVALRHFGYILKHNKISNKTNIKRELIHEFLDGQKANKPSTVNNKLSDIKEFLEWLGLQASNFVRTRDFLKTSKNDVDWLDEPMRKSIKEHLSKIPAPIARHYLIQEYTAARPGDVCWMTFDCLVEEDGKWYVKFYQHKVQRWHSILVTREIRRVIEQQQQWIRQTFGAEYEYLFCHFRGIRADCYPVFPKIRPLPIPPVVNAMLNQMVRIIRLLIEKENILDSNGLKPHFTGKITRASKLQEIREEYGIEAAQLYADHLKSTTTFQHYAPPTREQVAAVDLPFQKLLMNPEKKFLPWQSLPESLLENPKAHELDIEIPPRFMVCGYCILDPKVPCPFNFFPNCFGCNSFRPSTDKLHIYERQYESERQRMEIAEKAGAELIFEEAKATIEAMDKWLPDLRRRANGEI